MHNAYSYAINATIYIILKEQYCIELSAFAGLQYCWNIFVKEMWVWEVGPLLDTLWDFYVFLSYNIFCQHFIKNKKKYYFVCILGGASFRLFNPKKAGGGAHKIDWFRYNSWTSWWKMYCNVLLHTFYYVFIYHDIFCDE